MSTIRVTRFTCALLAVLCLAIPQPLSAQEPASHEKLFSYDTRVPARYDVRSTTKVDGVELRELTYKSPHGGTVGAFLVVPAGKGPFPLVIYGHWGNGTKSSFLPEALLLARAGVACFLADAPFARALDSYREANGPEARAVYIQTVVDTRVALDFLLREPFIDRTRIGYVGLSFGAQVGAILAGIEPRIRAAVIMGGLPSLARALRTGEHPALVKLREGVQDKAGFERFLAGLAEVDSERFVRAAHPPILFQFGRYDAAIPESAARELAGLTSDPKEVRWYVTGHEFNDVGSLNDRLAWLGRQLGFDAPCASVAAACHEGQSPTASASCRAPAAAAEATGAERAFHQLVAALARHDLRATMSLMTDDVVLVKSGRQDAGRRVVEAAFRERWTREPERNVTAQVEEVCEGADMATIRVNWTAAVPGPTGEMTTRGERDLEVWVKEADGWRLKRGLSYPMQK